MARITKRERLKRIFEGFTERQIERARRQALIQDQAQQQPARTTGYRQPLKNPTPEQLLSIEHETRLQFPLGATVQLSAKGRNQFGRQRWDRTGKVTGYSSGGDFRLGFSALVNVMVHWDGVKQPSSGVYRDNLEVIRP